jgi:hypothetical protein
MSASAAGGDVATVGVRGCDGVTLERGLVVAEDLGEDRDRACPDQVGEGAESGGSGGADGARR